MDERILRKIPQATLTRLENYVCIAEAGGDIDYVYGKIVTACSVLYDCGYLTMVERAEVSRYFRSRVDEVKAL